MDVMLFTKLVIRVNLISIKNLFAREDMMTPCINAKKTSGLSSDVREMGNGRYEQKAAHAINQVLRELERLQSVR